MDILSFKGEHDWLSNFFPTPVELDGERYASVEHAYQAAKTHHTLRAPFMLCSAAEAKKHGKTVILRSGWDDDKINVMWLLLGQKFAPGTELAEKLLNTGNVAIVEGNHWGDTFWGVCNGKGRNMLGYLLMKQRSFLSSIATVPHAEET